MKSDLINYKYNKYSQWGEDGILEEILTRLEIKNSLAESRSEILLESKCPYSVL